MQHDPAIRLMQSLDSMGRRSMRLRMATGRPYRLKPLEVHALEALYRAEQEGEEELTPSQLSGNMEIHSPILSPILSALERREYLARRADERDRRRSCLSLTAKGREVARDFIGQKEGMTRRMADYLGEGDTLELIRLIEKINGYILTEQERITAWKKGEKPLEGND